MVKSVRLLCIPIVCYLIAGVLLLGACDKADDSRDSAREAAFSLDVAAVAERLNQELDYRDRLEELDPGVVYVLLGIREEEVRTLKGYFSSGATAEEIIVLQAAEAESIKTLRAALEDRIAYQKEIYASYAPEEVRYLQGAILLEKGEYLIYCVAADAEKAERLAEQLLTNP